MESCHSDVRPNCRTVVLFQAWIDHLSGKERRPGSLRPSHALKGASLAMCDRKAASIVSSAQTSPSPADELVAAAEAELAAFYSAISATYGPEEAMLAADEWIEELERPDREELKSPSRPYAGSLPNLRHVTINAARRVASRIVHGTK